MTERSVPTGAAPGAVGFLTDSTLCIGCKACEVACKQWNKLEMDPVQFTGFSYDNTVDLSAETWRHVKFVEQPLADGPAGRVAWLMVSDVCKHCVNAACLQACPTGAIVRTEFGTVVIRQDICNGCGYCVPACPFGVPQLSHLDGRSHKCTLCYDRISFGRMPACAQACPTESIKFGPIAELYQHATDRVEQLRSRSHPNAYIYGDREIGGTGGIDGLNAMFILTAPPETYNLPTKPSLPQDRVKPAFVSVAVAAASLSLAIAGALWRKR
ncbi:MAG: 4Fe-4S dicluster domain-containing protein [Thermomicrobiales bacterium]